MTKKTRKKILSLLLAATMLLTLCACGKKEETKPADADKTPSTNNKPEMDIVAEAEALIAAGKYEDAYMLLKDVNEFSGNKAAMELRDKLVWVPVEWEWEYTDNRNKPSDREANTYHWICRYTYDENGLLLKKDAEPMPSSYLQSDQNSETYDKTYTYDENGNCLTIGSQDGTVTYTYDKNGNMLSKKSGAILTTCTYDANGNMLTERFESSSRIEENTYTYDADGNMLTSHKIWTFPEKGTTSTYKTTYTYDEKGRPLTRHEVKTSSDEEGERVEGEGFTYDAEGRPITYYDRPSMLSMTVTYDKKGHLIKVDIDGGDEKEGSISYAYDKDGRLTKHTCTLHDPKEGESLQEAYTYTYDEKERCVTCTSSNHEIFIQFYFNEQGRCVREKNVRDSGYDVQYNIYGKPISGIDQGGDRKQRIAWKLFYYPNGAPASVKDIQTPEDHNDFALQPTIFHWIEGPLSQFCNWSGTLPAFD